MDTATANDELPEPTRIAAERIAELFDRLASDYNKACANKAYLGPSLTGDLIQECISDSSVKLSVLDIGCGTGLLAPVLRSVAGRLEGVDVSSKMLEIAQSTGAYDSLVHADTIDHLSDQQSQYDLIVAIGTLHYLGDLSVILRQCLEALRPGGYFLFTLAAGPLMGESYDYQSEGYFTHAPRYLMQQLGELGVAGGEIRRVLWPAPDSHAEYALLVAVQRPEQIEPAEHS